MIIGVSTISFNIIVESPTGALHLPLGFSNNHDMFIYFIRKDMTP